MPLKLHYFQVSEPSRAVAWFIRTHKLPVEFVDVDFLGGETNSAAFTAKNAFQAVPVLELEDGGFMNESGAILFYLAKKFNVKGEIPETLEGEAKVLSAMLNNPDLSRNVTTGLALGAHAYIAGDAWTLADYNVAAEVSQWERISPILPDDLKASQFPNVQKYVERVSQRAGWGEFIAPFQFAVSMLQVPQ